MVQTITLHGKINKNFIYPFLKSLLCLRLVVKVTQQPLYSKEIATVSIFIVGLLGITACPEGRKEKIS